MVNRRLWQHPWKYKEGFVIIITLFVIGLLLEYFTAGAGIEALLIFPGNIILAATIIIIITILSAFRKNLALAQWLESIPAALYSIGFMLLVSLIMGLTLQQSHNSPEIISKLRFNNITTSWQYLLANMFLLISLGMVIIKNIKSFRIAKIGYMLSHVGLWIVIFTSGIGINDQETYRMEITEGTTQNIAFNEKEGIQLPFAITLNDFILDEYPPKLTVVDNITGNVISGSNNIVMIDTSSTIKIGNWNITTTNYEHFSAKAGNKYYFNNEIGAAPSVFVSAVSNSDSVSGWVSCGSFNSNYESLKLDQHHSLIMLFPEPKKFTSKIDIITDDSSIPIDIEVNKPYTLNNWKIYQTGYDDELGSWSRTSIFEIVKDPWLYVVYMGIGMMFLGAVYYLFAGAGSLKKKRL